ncbi:acylphosphatase [Candidatus Woesearchaeota archaeon]|nr:acylphosphatase [Candidatus Woesearchaeota archaeon]
MIRKHIFIKGKVTGVFFRAFIRERALDLGLNGWVKNLDENIVEAVFEGEKEKVDKIIELCNMGPSKAIVKNIEIIQEKIWGEKSFVVK